MSLFDYKIQEHEDYYKILGCSILSSTDQIITEYRKKVISCHPDKNPDDIEAKRRFELLQLAKDTLTDDVMREKYNNWLNSGICMSWKDWLRHSQTHQMVFHWVNKQTDAMIEGNNVASSQTARPTANQSTQPTRFWANDEASSNDMLRKFRNYEI